MTKILYTLIAAYPISCLAHRNFLSIRYELNNVNRDVPPYDEKMYEGHLESKERFAIQRYLLIIGKKQNMQVLSHTFTYFST